MSAESTDTPESIPLLSRGADQRVAILSALGNGLCIPLATQFILAYMDTLSTLDTLKDKL